MIRMARRGNRAAFGRLYADHVALVRRYARRVVRDEQTADDLVAEAFLRTWLQLLAGRGPDREFAAYVRTAVLNIHLSHLARSRRVALVADFEVAAEVNPDLVERLVEHSPEDLAVIQVLHSRINQALLSLPERWRAVLTLVYLEDLPYAKVAPHLGLTVDATHQLSVRARAGFRKALTDLQRRDGEDDALSTLVALRRLHDARRAGR